MNPYFLKHLERVAEDHQAGHFAGVTEVVEEVGVRKPIPLESFVREKLGVFGGSQI